MRWVYLLVVGGCVAHAACTDATPPKKVEAEEPADAAKDAAKPHGQDESHAENHAAKKPLKENRLAGETSPYLLLHKHNPVEWYPWGAEALAKARRENKLIFLSIGYSSCQWCHVMERESFMDDGIAAIVKKHFVCIKVDREERPDVDDVYMTALHVMGRQGGWPLSMFLTPEAKPIAGGTYFPRKQFASILEQSQKLWSERSADLKKQAAAVAKAVQENMRSRPAEKGSLDAKAAQKVFDALARQFDFEHGGFGFSANPHTPKFPEPSNLLFLLDYIDRQQAAIDRQQVVVNEGDQEKVRHAKKMLVETLDRMAAGGMWDHVGGGFHRYSTDRFWHIPHFEKMLYDNGQLASVYARAYALTGNEQYRNVVRRLIEFSDREMRHPQGGYYSALDAESNGKEGGFYIWQLKEIRAALTEDEYAIASAVYELGEKPNFKDPHSTDTAYVFVRPKSLNELAKSQKLSPEQLKDRLQKIHAKLFKQRAPRKRPLLDTKILTGWNGLMIRGLADAGRLFKDDAYTKSAARTADFVLGNLRTDDGRLLRTHTDGKAKLNAYLVDYAYLIDGLIALHQATGKQNWLDEADALMQKQIELFSDKEHGGFFFTSDDHESLYARSKRAQDGARPSGNSVSADNLAYLGRVLDKPEYLAAAKKTALAFAALAEKHPTAMPRMAVAVEALLGEESKSEPRRRGGTEEKKEGKKEIEENESKKKE
jgi:uncharacterized protein YyaL (SSP411 family)